MLTEPLQLGTHTRVEIVRHRDGSFAGIGAVRVDDVDLRNPAQPIRLCIDTVDGIVYPRLEIDQIVSDGHDTRIEMTAHGYATGRMTYLDDYDQPLRTLPQLPEEIHDRVTLILAPAKEKLGGRHFHGLSVIVEFASSHRQICRLTIESSWEIGGSITGNTVLHQGQCNRPVYYGGRDALFTTACLKTLEQYGSPQGYSFQLAPRAGLLQGVDFQYSDQGILLQEWPELESISSLVESPVGSDLLQVIDEYRGPLATTFRTQPQRHLFCAGHFPAHECRDVWLQQLSRIYGGIRKRFQVKPSRAYPEAIQQYHTRVVDGGLEISVHGEFVPSHAMLHTLADKALPVLAKEGFRWFAPSVVNESDVTEYGLKRKLDNGIHGDLHCASICATHRFFPADFWGGMTGWKYMADRAHDLGMKIGTWFAPHYSPRAPIVTEHPEYMMIDAASKNAGGGYGFQTIVVADWNTGIFDYTLDCVRRWKEEGGLDYLFIDSYSNMGLLQQNHACDMRTNYAPLARLFREFQKLGIEMFSFESVSAFGIGRFGLSDLRGDLAERDRSVAGQNDFGWWLGEEDMAVDIQAMVSPRKRSADELATISFRFMANRGVVVWQRQFNDNHGIPAWWKELNHIYLQVVDEMDARTLLPDDAGTVWRGDHGYVIWSYKDQQVPDELGGQLEEITAAGAVPVAGRRLAAMRVYRIHG